MPWTKKEDAILRRNYTRHGGKYTSALLGRSLSGVHRRAETLGIPGCEMKQWTAIEDKHLRRAYATHTAAQIARTLKRTEQSVRGRINKLGLGVAGPPKWIAVEIEYLRENYGTTPMSEMTLELGRSADAIQLKAQRLGLGRTIVPFTPSASQLNYIVSNLGTISYSQMARKFGVSTERIRRIAEENGYRDRPQSREWTGKDLERLRRLFGTMSREAVAAKLDRTVIAITDRARKLGLTRKMPSTAGQRPWTSKEIQLLRRHNGRKTYAEIGELIGRSRNAVSARAGILGLTKARAGRRRNKEA